MYGFRPFWTIEAAKIRDTSGPGEEGLHGQGSITRESRPRDPAEEKILIVFEGLRGEESIATRCRKEGLAPNLYYRWSKEFLEAGKKRLVGDTTREATSRRCRSLPSDPRPKASSPLHNL